MKPVCENKTKSNVSKKKLKAQKFVTLQTLELEIIMAMHCVNIVVQCSFFGLYSPAFGQNMKIY